MNAIIELSKSELEAALELIDIALKATGLHRAQNAVVLSNKFGAALTAMQQPEANGAHLEESRSGTGGGLAAAAPAAS